MTENERLTHLRMSGTASGYWTAASKTELIARLAEYENTRLQPDEIRVMVNEMTLEKGGRAPRVLILPEIRTDEVYWLELDDVMKPIPISIETINLDEGYMDDYSGSFDELYTSEYNIHWRLWSKRPSSEDMDLVPWEEEWHGEDE